MLSLLDNLETCQSFQKGYSKNFFPNKEHIYVNDPCIRSLSIYSLFLRVKESSIQRVQHICYMRYRYVVSAGY